ncbi:hypothetical protein [Hymenobacter properus]|uniref:DUF4381 domain-containing protein n=1 Tax=Hymenobacter properus TaxID=2791026 RepID=A0A931FLD9_9BACT|nr:hypothetical protein [Hymenobacter properus]MBF9144088.1 hypothetical protein [Hymenobacter properus]MBR7722904.1 hypothetical protein [Microvirga sp. SRT04]
MLRLRAASLSMTFCFLTFWFIQPVLAQTGSLPVPQGRFLKQTVLVGEPLDYELRYEHAPGLEVVFPDSLAAFAPFEYAGKTYYPTRTRRGVSLDRTVYHLRTFRLDSVQTLALPVAVLQGPDTLSVLPPPSRVRLRRTAPTTVGEELPALRQNLALVPVEPVFNYPYWIAGALAVLLLAAGSATLFRRRLTRRYQAYKLRKNHGYFLAQFARHVERFDLSRSATNVERAVVLWKNYLAGLENSGLNSFTTREIVAYFENDADVRKALTATDKVIYGNLQSEDAKEVDRAFQRLRSFAERRYAAVVEQ